MALRPDVGPPTDVLSSGRPAARRARVPGWLVVGLAAAALIGFARLTSDEPAPAPRAAPVPVATPAPPSAAPLVGVRGYGRPLAATTGVVQDVALAGDALYVLQTPPTRLLRLTRIGRVTRSVPAPRYADRLAVDVAKRIVWVWTSNRETTTVQAYDALTLRRIGRTRLAEEAFGGVAYRGALWLGAAVDFVRIRPGGQAYRVASANYVFDVAVDAANDRVVAALGDAVGAYDVRSLRLVARRPVSLGQLSLAVVGNDLWVGGFSDSGRRLLHLDARSFRPEPVRGADVDVGEGAIVWPGTSAVWVRDGGSEDVTCVDPTTGAPLARWLGLMGRVTSQGDLAYAIVGQGVVRLSLGKRCTG
jgi:hypothetical protein